MTPMRAEERIRMIRLLEKLAGDPAFAAALGVEWGWIRGEERDGCI